MLQDTLLGLHGAGEERSGRSQSWEGAVQRATVRVFLLPTNAPVSSFSGDVLVVFEVPAPSKNEHLEFSGLACGVLAAWAGRRCASTVRGFHNNRTIQHPKK